MNIHVYQPEWVAVPGYNQRYFIHVKSAIVSFQNGKGGKFVTRRIDRGGYITVRLSNQGKTTTHFLHRLIAEAYLPNPENKPFINHINGVKTDNCIENLEWVTHAENIKHGYLCGLCKSQLRQTPVINICSGKKFPSIKKAAEFHSLKYATCKGYLNGTRKNPTCLRYLDKAV